MRVAELDDCSQLGGLDRARRCIVARLAGPESLGSVSCGGAR
jgi:hypothetical protein